MPEPKLASLRGTLDLMALLVTLRSNRADRFSSGEPSGPRQRSFRLFQAARVDSRTASISLRRLSFTRVEVIQNGAVIHSTSSRSRFAS
jgi:hypothetical protein